MITNLRIKNFRAFKDFELKNLNQITLIGGRNNSGKSAILESIFLNFGIQNSNVFGIPNPNVFYILAALRNEFPSAVATPVKIWTPLFHNYNESNEIDIQLTRDGNCQSFLSIKKVPDNTFASSAPPNALSTLLNQGISPNHLGEYFYALDVSYSLNDFKITGRYQYRKDGIQFILGAETKENNTSPLKVFLYTSKNTQSNAIVAEWFSQLNLLGKKSKIIEMLRIFDPDIEDIITVAENGTSSLYVQFQTGSIMPLSMLGDGINKAFQILLIILTTPNGIVLIDEIENGFHYSIYTQIITMFYQAAIKYNTQLIITTHNLDILKTFSSVMCSNSVADNEGLNRLTYERIDFSQNQRRAFSFTGEELLRALDAKLEVR